MISVGTAFITTGGEKIIRAIRSLRRTEPYLEIHVVVDTSSSTWIYGGSSALRTLQSMPMVKVKLVENKHHINGALNQAMRWLCTEGYNYGCLFHDDVIFTPFKEHQHHLSVWFDILTYDRSFREASGLTLGLMETGITGADGDLFTGNRPSSAWDIEDLESPELWEKLLPDKKTPGGFLPDGKTVTERADVFRMGDLPIAIRYYCGHIDKYTRLGPTGQIVPMKIWEQVGGFDETEGIHYDAEYPAKCAMARLPPIQVVPNIPHLHIHNQSIGYLDPSTGLWGNVSAAFERVYGKDFWSRKLENR